jgi:hypothetical protein
MRIQALVVLGSLVAACGVGGVEELAPEVGVRQEALLRSATYAGNTVVLGSTMNDAAWWVNMSDSLVPLSTQLSLTLTHGGSLQNGYGKLGHIAVSIRGGSAERSFAQLGWPLQTGTHFFGEQITTANAEGRLSTSNMYELISGRGITFWPVGTPGCPVATKPCAIFENYTAHAFQGGGLMTQGTMALDVGTGPFSVTLTADSTNTTVTVTQNGVQKLYASCRLVTGNDSRCGDTAYNVALADAWVGFVAAPAPAMQGYTVGATSFSLRHEVP